MRAPAVRHSALWPGTLPQCCLARGIHLPHRSPVGWSLPDMVFTHRVQSEPVGCYQHLAGSPAVVGGAGIEPATFSVSGRRAPAAPTALAGETSSFHWLRLLLRPEPVSEPVDRSSIFRKPAPDLQRLACPSLRCQRGALPLRQSPSRRRRESNPRTGLCRPLPKPLGHSASANVPCWGNHGFGHPKYRAGLGLRDGIRRLRADDGIRTRDPHLGKVMLYQLSHVRIPARAGWCTPARAGVRSEL